MPPPGVLFRKAQSTWVSSAHRPGPRKYPRRPVWGVAWPGLIGSGCLVALYLKWATWPRGLAPVMRIIGKRAHGHSYPDPPIGPRALVGRCVLVAYSGAASRKKPKISVD